MKINFSKSKSRRGIMLVECMVYLVVFLILTGIGTASFYLLWDNSNALRYQADDIHRALSAGEMWRADIRSATGKIQVENSTNDALIKIPNGKNEIVYHFSGGEVWRKGVSGNLPALILSRVKTSEMQSENRNQINAWQWELELVPHRARAKVPLLFTFEAVAPAKS